MTSSTGQAGLQLLLLFAFLIPAVFFLVSQQNVLRLIKRENRLMQPGLVWLQLIPFFGNLWQFFVITRIAGSIQRQQASQFADTIFGEDALIAETGGSRRPTQGIGIAYCILDTMVLLVELTSPQTAVLGGAMVWAMFICWIIYWVQLGRYKNKLKRMPV
jgi:hypothetical protein